MAAPRTRHSRDSVAKRTQREFEALDALIARLKPADWARPVPRPETRDPWTVKDSIAHIVHWKEHTARVLRRERRPPELRGLEVGAINAIVYARWRGRSTADVVAWHRAVHEDVMRTIAAVPEERFSGRERSPFWPGDFDGHSVEHRVKDIEAALSHV